MSVYKTVPVPNVYPQVIIPVAEPTQPAYSWGHATGYNDAASGQPNVLEYAEAMPANGTAGRQFALRTQVNGADTQNSLAITWATEFPSVPSTVNVVLQGAVIDQDAQYFTIDTSTNAAGETRTIQWGQTKVNFLRIKVVTSTGGSSPTLIVKFVI